MASYDIQFQKGLSLREFNAAYATEEQCREAIHLLTQGKHSVSALELKRQLGVHYETAWSMKQKILLVMAEREEDRRLTGRVEVDDAYDGGERHEGKRGRGAEGKTPFVVAVQTDVENPDQVLFLKMKTLEAVSTKELKPWFEEDIEPGPPGPLPGRVLL